ncbi:protein rogdi-like [Haliotis rubra]|uniref:protein rogdi-like n=1 Tax=Haliotis rubra TaxID=36100 RepID=UPI001EE5968F|nr:protein rogdi-like [Haliotis rubra]
MASPSAAVLLGQQSCGGIDLLDECSKRFPIQTLPGGDNAQDLRQIKAQRILMNSPNGTGHIKCMVTLKGDSIFEADINFKHKQGRARVDGGMGRAPHLQDQHPGAGEMGVMVAGEEGVWVDLGEEGVFIELGRGRDLHGFVMLQIQDAGNHLCRAMMTLNSHDGSYKFKSGTEVILLLDDIMKSLLKGRGSLTLPKRKSLQELVNNRNMHVLYPPVPSDIALSFYIHASKLILALYHVHITGQKIEVTARYQVETVVQWLNDAIMLFTLALQQCQQLKDKLTVLLQYKGIS